MGFPLKGDILTDENEKAEMLRFLKRLEEEQWEACLALDVKAVTGREKYLIWDAFLGFHPMRIVTGLGEHAAGSFRHGTTPWHALSYVNPGHDQAAAGFRRLSFDLWKAEERERDQRLKLEEERSDMEFPDLSMAFQAI